MINWTILCGLAWANHPFGQGVRSLEVSPDETRIAVADASGLFLRDASTLTLLHHVLPGVQLRDVEWSGPDTVRVTSQDGRRWAVDSETVLTALSPLDRDDTDSVQELYTEKVRGGFPLLPEGVIPVFFTPSPPDEPAWALDREGRVYTGSQDILHASSDVFGSSAWLGVEGEGALVVPRGETPVRLDVNAKVERRAVGPLSAFRSSVAAVQLREDGEVAWVGYADGTVLRHDLVGRSVTGAPGDRDATALDRQGDALLWIGDSAIERWDLGTGQLLWRAEGAWRDGVISKAGAVVMDRTGMLSQIDQRGRIRRSQCAQGGCDKPVHLDLERATSRTVVVYREPRLVTQGRVRSGELGLWSSKLKPLAEVAVERTEWVGTTTVHGKALSCPSVREIGRRRGPKLLKLTTPLVVGEELQLCDQRLSPKDLAWLGPAEATPSPAEEPLVPPVWSPGPQPVRFDNHKDVPPAPWWVGPPLDADGRRVEGPSSLHHLRPDGTIETVDRPATSVSYLPDGSVVLRSGAGGTTLTGGEPVEAGATARTAQTILYRTKGLGCATPPEEAQVAQRAPAAFQPLSKERRWELQVRSSAAEGHAFEERVRTLETALTGATLEGAASVARRAGLDVYRSQLHGWVLGRGRGMQRGDVADPADTAWTRMSDGPLSARFVRALPSEDVPRKPPWLRCPTVRVDSAETLLSPVGDGRWVALEDGFLWVSTVPTFVGLDGVEDLDHPFVRALGTTPFREGKWPAALLDDTLFVRFPNQLLLVDRTSGTHRMVPLESGLTNLAPVVVKGRVWVLEQSREPRLVGFDGDGEQVEAVPLLWTEQVNKQWLDGDVLWVGSSVRGELAAFLPDERAWQRFGWRR